MEEGSLAGVSLGAVLLAGAGVVAAYLLHHQGFIAATWVFPAIAFGVVGGLAGGMIGSVLPIGSPSHGRAAWQQRVTDASVVRLTNLNVALGAIVVFILMTVLLVGLVVATVREGKNILAEITSDLRMLLIPVFYVAITVVALRAVLWVDVGREVTLRRLLGSRRYPLAELQACTFETNGGRVLDGPPLTRCAVKLSMAGAEPLTVSGVSPDTARRLSDVLAYHAAQSSQPHA